MTKVASTDKLLLSVAEAAKLLGISERALWAITCPRGTLKPVRIGARVLYSPLTLGEWIASQEASADA